MAADEDSPAPIGRSLVIARSRPLTGAPDSRSAHATPPTYDIQLSSVPGVRASIAASRVSPNSAAYARMIRSPPPSRRAKAAATPRSTAIGSTKPSL